MSAPAATSALRQQRRTGKPFDLLLQFPDGRRSDLDAEGGQLAVHATVTQLGFSLTRRSTSRRIEATVRGPPGPAGSRVASAHQIAAPSQDRVQAEDQMHPAQRITRHGLEQRCEEGPVLGGEPGRGRTQLLVLVEYSNTGRDLGDRPIRSVVVAVRLLYWILASDYPRDSRCDYALGLALVCQK